MVRFRNTWLVAVVALGLGGAACKKSDDAKPGDKTATGDKSAPNGGGTTISDSAGGDLSLLPVDSEMVIGLNIAQLQQSALWKQFSPKIMDKVAGNLADFKADCGFDPLDAVKSIAMGMKNMGGGGEPDGAIVIHGPDKAKVLACVDKEKDKAKAKGTEMSVDGDVVLMKDKNGATSAFTFVNDTTMLGVIGTKGNKDGVKDAAKGTSTLKSSQTFVDMYSKINTQDSLWMLINGNSPALAKAGGMGIKPKAVFGSLNITDGLTLDFRVRMATPEEAKSLVGMMQGQVGNPQVKQMFDTLDITGDGTDAKVTVKMSAQKLQAMVAMVGGMMGGMLGGAGAAGGGGGGMGGAPGGTP